MAVDKQETKTKKAKQTDESALKELFLNELKDIYWAEKHLVKNLPKMAKAATSTQLQKAFEDHLAETQNQVSRLESVFESIGEKASVKKCEAMDGLVEEAHEVIEDTEDGTLTRDVALICSGQKVEHYEIASYGTLRTLAGVLGFAQAASLLEETLQEEKNADSLLTQIAEGFVNEAAKKEKK
ncbi:MAG: ferritin-like domain-containing protein [Bacteroidota bacterium]